MIHATAHRRIKRCAPGPLVAVLAIAIGGCGSNGATLTPGPGTTPVAAPSAAPASPAGPVPVLFDTDLSADDAMALPFLVREPAMDVLAITVVGTGLVHCAQGLDNVTAFLTALGSADVPVACGRSLPLAGSHAFPDAWRAGADANFGLSLDVRPAATPSQSAPELIRSVAASAPRPITIVATGPLTNLAEAFRGDPSLTSHVERIVAMGGAVDVAGNVDLGSGPTPAEWNVYADPTAADIVFRTGVPITLVPLDATNDVPINAEFLARLEADHTAAPADLVYELLLRGALTTSDYFWDPLAAVVAVDESVAMLESARLRVVTDEGADSGRTERSEAGVPVRVTTAADRAAFEDRFLAGLRVGAPRPHPFQIEGTMQVRFDGTTCVEERPDAPASGNWLIRGDTTADGTTLFALTLFHEGYGWQDLVDYIDGAPDPTAQPPFVDVPAYSVVEGGGSATMTATLEPGTYAVVCLSATNSASRAIPASGPFTVEQ